MRRETIVSCIYCLSHIALCKGFLPNTYHKQIQSNLPPIYDRSVTIGTNKSNLLQLNSFNDATNKEEENNQPPTFILSFDGVVANTAPTRASIAIEAALQTWPQLQENIAVQQTSDLSWLNNKIQALLHVTESSNEGLMGCEAVILARMLIEEQMLDEGRSIGKSGKYASKFHPTSENENIVNENKRRNKSGSRPLTVGEIAANWEANLVDSLFVKYNVNGKSPLPKIRKHLVQLVQKAVSHNSSNLFAFLAFSSFVHVSNIILQRRNRLHPHLFLKLLKRLQVLKVKFISSWHIHLNLN